MDTNICVNKVFTDVRNNKQFRLLWIDPQGSESYVFWLHEKTGVPSSIRINEIEEGLEKGWLAETEDPFGMTREPSREEMERRDRIWEQMKDALQDEPGIYNKKIRSQHLKKIEDEGGEKVPNLYRHLGRYWERGKTPDAFLPGYNARGREGETQAWLQQGVGRSGKRLWKTNHASGPDEFRSGCPQVLPDKKRTGSAGRVPKASGRQLFGFGKGA